MEIFHENFLILLTRHGIKKPKAPFSGGNVFILPKMSSAF